MVFFFQFDPYSKKKLTLFIKKKGEHKNLKGREEQEKGEYDTTIHFLERNLLEISEFLKNTKNSNPAILLYSSSFFFSFSNFLFFFFLK